MIIQSISSIALKSFKERCRQQMQVSQFENDSVGCVLNAQNSFDRNAYSGVYET